MPTIFQRIRNATTVDQLKAINSSIQPAVDTLKSDIAAAKQQKININLNIENFRITECGDLQDIVNGFNGGGIEVNTNEAEAIPVNLRA